jgi:hypothetical protein
LRPFGVVEFFSLLGVVLIALILNDVRNGVEWVSDGWLSDALVVVGLAGAVAARVAVALEYVEAGPTGVRYRALFRSSVVPWEQIESIDTSTMPRFPAIGASPVIRLNLIDGSDRRLRGSAGCESASRDWIRAASSFLVTDRGPRCA